jgi:hypothetical protein
LQALVLVVLALMLSLLMWELVHSAPPVLGKFLPRGFTLGIGGTLFFVGIWSAFTAAHYTYSAADILFAMVQMYCGLWFMLAPSAGMRGSESDQRFLRRLFGMIGIVMAALIGSMYLNNQQASTVLQLLMIGGGFWVTMNYLRLSDRGG